MKKLIYLCLISLLLPTSGLVSAREEAPVVRSVLFYSPTCPHCHQVLDEVLPPLMERYDQQIYILLVDTSKEEGSQLYQAMATDYEIARERLGVPTLVVGEVVLVGSIEIPERFPGLIDAALVAGGNSWPIFAGFDPAAAEAIFAGRPVPVAEEEAGGAVPGADFSAVEMKTEGQVLDNATSIAEGTEALTDGSDPVGFVLAAILTLIMLGALGYAASQGRPLHERLKRLQEGPIKSGIVPVLLVVGLGVSIYLTYVEINEVAAVCGPAGNCNFVQSSPYARIFGVPVAVLGIAYYLSDMILWWGQRTLRGIRLRMATATFVAMTAAGTLFSIYLTLLELFVIEAICAWCMTSALVTTVVLVVVVTLILERVPAPEKETALPAL